MRFILGLCEDVYNNQDYREARLVVNGYLMPHFNKAIRSFFLL